MGTTQSYHEREPGVGLSGRLGKIAGVPAPDPQMTSMLHDLQDLCTLAFGVAVGPN